MPIFRINTQLHYFAHVPKCGGTAVEGYLTARFGPLGLFEQNRHLIPLDQRWSRTATEHLSVNELKNVIPADWLASSFAVVRHPLRRLISAFFFSRDMTRHTALGADFNAWALEQLQKVPTQPYLLEGHLRPQSELVPQTARIFRLEDGLEPIIPYLDGLAGNTEGPREIAPRNVGKWRNDEAEPVPSDAVLALIAKVYAADFARFGYDAPTSTAAAAALPDLPALAATGKPPAAGRRPLMNRIYRHLMAKAERK